MACVRVVVVVVLIVVVTLSGRWGCQGEVLAVPRMMDPLQKSLQQFGNISKIEAMLPRLGGVVRTAAMRGGGERLEVNSTHRLNSLSAVLDCNKTFALDDGQAALLYSRSDLYRYTCRQVFTAINLDSKLEFACYSLSLKFNCFLEALKVTVDGEEEVYCRNDAVPIRKGKEVEVEYVRKIGGINGIFVCTVTAEMTLPSRLTEDPCGVTSSMEEGVRAGAPPPVLRVVGGEDASQGEYPWMAFLIMQAGDISFSCGGTLITSSHVLSAAHCFYGDNVEKIKVGLGNVHRTMVGGSAPWMWFLTSTYKMHPEYSPDTIHNDLAVVTLNSPVTFTHYIRPACLPTADRNLEGATLTATGWGLMDYNDPDADLPIVLQEVDLTAWNNVECQDVWRNLMSSHVLLNSQLCASRPGKDTCSGDSGGPLLLKADGRWTVVGVTSYGYKCAEIGKPGVYTRVSKFLTWINCIIQGDDCEEG
ncbi:serine protease 42-like [Portunus trituberculatus]|nr:serine protease 42-like [Portunus trituberculatus]